MFQYIYVLIYMLVGALLVTQVLAQEADETDVAVVNADGLTAETCGKKHKSCCSELYIGEEETLTKCFSIHSSKLPPAGDSDVIKSLKFLSCFVECIYKQRKYIGKSDTINMKMVKLDAEILFKDRPKEQAYHIKMFDYCRKDAVDIYKLVKSSPGGKAIMKHACRPFLLMVYLCISDYHQKHECPYFRWEGDDKSGTKQMCIDAKAKCYEIDGITLKEN